MADTSANNRSVSERHNIALSFVPQEQKKDTYDKWGPRYDEDMWVIPIHSWNIGAKMVFELLGGNFEPGHVPLVVDAGCGTGGPGAILRKLADENDLPIRIIGYDFSEGMLKQAQGKGVYDKLFVGDLLGEVPVKHESADYAMSFGVFVDGSDHPEALAKILGHLCKGGMAVVTFRINTFERMKEDYYKTVEKAGCAIVEERVDKYYGADNALYITFKK